VRNGHSDAAAILAAIRRAAPRSQDLTLNSSHPQGGNPMSDRPDVGVVDSGFRVHGTRNVYVCDASVFPTSIRINPQETIMAFADYAWETSLAAGIA
jgi:choline dehydrogenase-like flavoprotein